VGPLNPWKDLQQPEVLCNIFMQDYHKPCIFNTTTLFTLLSKIKKLGKQAPGFLQYQFFSVFRSYLLPPKTLLIAKHPFSSSPMSI